MSFSPISRMDEFTVYKDVVLYLRTILFRSLYERKGPTEIVGPSVNAEDQNAIDILNSLLEESEDPTRRTANLNIKSKKMPPQKPLAEHVP